jgi:hypothetical protein
MVNLRKFLKSYRDAGAFHALFAPHRFINDSLFLTKSNQLGVVLDVDGIDPECLKGVLANEASATKRAEIATSRVPSRYVIVDPASEWTIVPAETYLRRLNRSSSASTRSTGRKPPCTLGRSFAEGGHTRQRNRPEGLTAFYGRVAPGSQIL